MSYLSRDGFCGQTQPSLFHGLKGSFSWRSLCFVANRMNEICTIDAQRRWTPGDCNTEDLPTRGTSIRELEISSLWWNGPSWLQLEEKWCP